MVEVVAFAGVGGDGDVGDGVGELVDEGGERGAQGCVGAAEIETGFEAGERFGDEVGVGVGGDGADAEGAVVFVERGNAEGLVGGGAGAEVGRGLPDEAEVGAELDAVLVGECLVERDGAGLAAEAVGVLPGVEAGAGGGVQRGGQRSVVAGEEAGEGLFSAGATIKGAEGEVEALAGFAFNVACVDAERGDGIGVGDPGGGEGAAECGGGDVVLVVGGSFGGAEGVDRGKEGGERLVLDVEDGGPGEGARVGAGKRGGEESFVGGVALEGSAVAAVFGVEATGDGEVECIGNGTTPGGLDSLIVEVGGAVDGARIADQVNAVGGEGGGVHGDAVAVVGG
ncbi:hypothetical protein RAHE111665_07915 [Rariglobus hedericola]